MTIFLEWDRPPWHDFRNSIQTVLIGGGVTSIGDWAFSDSRNLVTVIIDGWITRIGDSAFEDCRNLKGLTIP